MRKNQQEVDAKRRERFEVMAVRLANYLGLCSVCTFGELPPKIAQYFEGLTYSDIVKPLIIRDHSDGQSVRQLSFRYGISSSAIQKHIKRYRAPGEHRYA